MADLKLTVHQIPYSIMSLFEVGMDRRIAPFRPITENNPIILNLGAGYKHITGAIRMSWETGWHAPRLKNYKDGTVDGIFALHFFEHLDKQTLLEMLRECERVLRPGSPLNVVVPWYGAQLAYQDLDHKTFWTVETWKNLMDNKYYDGTMPREWSFRENFSIIMGLNDRNLVVVSQLVRT